MKSEFLKNWGWAIPTLMIPVCLAAGKYMFVTRAEFVPVQALGVETRQLLNYHDSDRSGMHSTYEERARLFVPRLELAPILQEIKTDQRQTNDKLDRILEELRAR